VGRVGEAERRRLRVDCERGAGRRFVPGTIGEGGRGRRADARRKPEGPATGGGERPVLRAWVKRRGGLGYRGLDKVTTGARVTGARVEEGERRVPDGPAVGGGVRLRVLPRRGCDAGARTAALRFVELRKAFSGGGRDLPRWERAKPSARRVAPCQVHARLLL
jgi:hypothetical protein